MFQNFTRVIRVLDRLAEAFRTGRGLVGMSIMRTWDLLPIFRGMAGV